MPIFVCEKCNCLENTACSQYWSREKGSPALCSQCDPEIGKWHGRFERREWEGNPDGICNKDDREFGYLFR
jgi:hypothetical protein